LAAKTNGITEAFTLGGSGAKTFLIARQNGITEVFSTGGSRATLVAKTNGIVGPRVAGGPWAKLVARQNAIVTPLSTGGSRATLAAKTNGIVSGRVIGGPQVRVIARSGGIVTARSLGGPKNLPGAQTQTTAVRLSLVARQIPTSRTLHKIVVRDRKTNAAHVGTIKAEIWEGGVQRVAT